MRIITGTLKGRRLKVPDSGVIRPTSDRTKEGMFGVIDARRYFDGLHVLDLFAGSGNLGFEAISRGADQVTFVDDNRLSAGIIAENAETFGITGKIRTIQADVMRFLNGPARPYDLIFCDPPYDFPQMDELVALVLTAGWMEPDGWFLLEHDKYKNFADHPNCVFSKPYGRTIVTIFTLPGNEEDAEL
ncbi:MAG: 16S rRNA (guanine(966)-N(2))-methyltransferase RsmD [Bacteroidetes bacterium HLUCCA01]|nr:MAG: 16S rRNA (guanine(966)-N(2))-methyltransferase RsmD [Bacteroidetes bacterium HLUCCA01]